MGCKREEGNVYKIKAGRSFLEKPTWKTREKWETVRVKSG
jgi:hypothetical protein